MDFLQILQALTDFRAETLWESLFHHHHQIFLHELKVDLKKNLNPIIAATSKKRQCSPRISRVCKNGQFIET